jgi:hypothetical protein
MRAERARRSDSQGKILYCSARVPLTEFYFGRLPDLSKDHVLDLQRRLGLL